MALSESSLWLQGPHWLHSKECLPDSPNDPMENTIPDNCYCEMKHKNLILSLMAVETYNPRLSQVIDPERYSLSNRLFHVTALVLKFVSCLRERVSHVGSLPPSSVSLAQSDPDQARLYWVKDSQSHLQVDKWFPTWRR